MAAESPGGGRSQWWSSFGEEYDDSPAAAGGEPVEPSALEVQLREDEAVVNARLLTQLRAKSQLLELETEAKNRLAAQLAAAQGGRRGGARRASAGGSDGLRRGSVGAVQVTPARTLQP